MEVLTEVRRKKNYYEECAWLSAAILLCYDEDQQKGQLIFLSSTRIKNPIWS